MKYSVAKSALALLLSLAGSTVCAQRAPFSAQQPWQAPANLQTAPARHAPSFTPDPGKPYTLPELVDLAEQNNPDTRVAWENAKVRAAALGIRKASLYPAVAAAALAQTTRSNILFYPAYVRETLYSFVPTLEVDYTIFDFGRRLDEIAVSRNNLLAANFQFNDTHRRIIFAVMSAYYRVLNTKGQEEAQEANQKNAQTVQQAAEARLELGLAIALDEMETIFARNLEMFAELAEQLLEHDQVAAVRRIRSLRDQINAGFQAVTAQADAVVFDFGAERQRKLQIREDICHWQPSIRTLLQVQITFAQYRIQKTGRDLPQAIHEADIAFEHDIALVMRAMAGEVRGKPAIAAPDIRASAARVQEETHNYFQNLSQPMSAMATDVMGLTQSLASILAPLYEDIRATFAAHSHSAAVQPQLEVGKA